MAGPDQSFGGWWTASDSQDFMDLDPLLYSAPQRDAPDRPPYDLNPEAYYGDDRASNPDWLSVAPGSLSLPVVHPFDGAPGSSYTAPPHRNPPSQIHGLRGYGTDPQSQEVSYGNSDTFLSGTFDRANGDPGSLILLGTRNHTQINLDPPLPRLGETRYPTSSLADDAAVTLIQSCVKLNPTTFFYKDKIEALVTLTSLPSQTIEKVIRQLLENGLPGQTHITGSSFATSQSLLSTNHTLSSATTAQSEPARTTDIQEYHAGFKQPNVLDSLEERPVLKQAARSLLDGRSDKCRPTSNRALLSRDEEKIYQCTFSCGARFTRKADLRRHEEEKNYPEEGWVCDVDSVVSVGDISTCAYCGLQNPSKSHAPTEHRNRAPFCHEKEIDARGKVFTRKKRFIEHFKSFHPTLPIADYLKTCRFVVQSKLPQWCGFCERSQDFHGSKVRNDHIASHFENGFGMFQWKEPPAPSKTVDEDGDTDGDGDEGDDDADDIDEDKDHQNREIHGRESRSKGGFSDGARFQNTRGANGSTSTRAPNGYSQHSLKHNTANTWRRSDVFLVRGLEAYKELPFDNSRHKTPCEESQGFRKRDIKTGGSGLEESLRNARVYQKSHTFFVPIDELQRLITFDSVSHELQIIYPGTPSIINMTNANIIVKDAPRLFGLLVSIGKEPAIIDFIEQGITDSNLPIRKASYNEVRAFAQWTPRAVENFDREQWSFLAPVFDQVGQHYEFEDSEILPFVDSNEHGSDRRIAGGYSEVWGVRVHPAHQLLLRRASPLGPEPLIALKRLYSTDPLDFEREVGILKEIAKKRHPHHIKLLATYRIDRSYHLLFPYANENLRTYWRNNRNPEWGQALVFWALSQMQGLASALEAIHNFGTQATENTSCSPSARSSLRESPERTEVFGRHGDIKPENILWFRIKPELESADEGGILQIADFGLVRFHRRGSRSNVNPRTVASTATYEPPEYGLSKPISRAYDIWSLGCVFLEFTTWILVGSEKVDAFANARLAIGKDRVMRDKFYTVQEDEHGKSHAFVQDTVIFWITLLHCHKRCSRAMHDLLDLIRDQILVINAKDRISSTVLLAKLQRLVKRAETDEAYLLDPAPYEPFPKTRDDTCSNPAPSLFLSPEPMGSKKKVLPASQSTFKNWVRTPRELPPKNIFCQHFFGKTAIICDFLRNTEESSSFFSRSFTYYFNVAMCTMPRLIRSSSSPSLAERRRHVGVYVGDKVACFSNRFCEVETQRTILALDEKYLLLYSLAELSRLVKDLESLRVNQSGPNTGAACLFSLGCAFQMPWSSCVLDRTREDVKHIRSGEDHSFHTNLDSVLQMCLIAGPHVTVLISWTDTSSPNAVSQGLEATAAKISSPGLVFDDIESKIASIKETLGLWRSPWLLVLDNCNQSSKFGNITAYLPQGAALRMVNNLGILYQDQGRLAEAEVMYKRALTREEKALGPDHTLTLETVNDLGDLYQNRGRLAEAGSMHERALTGRENALGPDYKSTLMSMSNLTILYSYQSRLAEAEAMFERALTGKEKVLGPDHASTLDTLNNLGILYWDQGRLAEAEVMFERALTGKEKMLGPDHTSTLRTVNNLGNLCHDQGRLAEAESMYERVLTGREKVLGPDHTSTLDTLNNLGILYWDQGRLAEAEVMFERALTGKEKVLGPDHTSTLDTLNNLGILYWDQGRLTGAEVMFERALTGKEKMLGPDHTSTLDTLNNLSILYWDQGRLAEAEVMFERALTGKEKMLGPDHTSTLRTVNNLGNLYHDQGRLAEAEAMYERALTGKEKMLGPDHTSTLDTLNNLGILYWDQGRLTEAEVMFERALTGKEKVLGPDHTSTLRTVNNLGNLYHDQGRLVEAESMCERVLTGKEKVLGPDHTSTLDTLNNLSILYWDQGRLAEAEVMFERALTGKEKVLGPDHTSTLRTVNNLGNLYRDQGRLAEAEAMYERVLTGTERVLGPDHKFTLDTVNNLGVLYQDQGRLAEAESMYERALTGRENALGPGHKLTLETVNNLAILYRDQGRVAEKEALYQRHYAWAVGGSAAAEASNASH